MAKRSFTAATNPSFMIRLDLNEQTKDESNTPSSSSAFQTVFHHDNRTNIPSQHIHSTDSIAAGNYFESKAPSDGISVTSYHLQSDYANMKNLQTELQRALDELNGVHAQRLTRYIS